MFQLVTEEILSNILIVADKNLSLGCQTKQYLQSFGVGKRTIISS